MLHLWEIEVWAGSSRNQLLCIVEEVQCKIKERCGHGLVIDCDASFVQVPSSRAIAEYSENNPFFEQERSSPYDEYCGIVAEYVLLSLLLEVDLATDSITKIVLPVD
jgi:hypothetical protein